MDNKSVGIKRITGSVYFKIVCSGLLLFVCAMLFVPAAGVFRTVPFLFAAGIILGFISVPIGISAALCTVMTACAYLATGRGVMEALLYAVVADILVLLGIYISKLFRISKKTKKASVKKKCVTMSALSAVVCVVLSVLLCGNVVSFIIKDSDNSKYIRGNYGNDVEIKFTSYDALASEYKTYVVFKDGDSVYGNDDDCYISTKKKITEDGIRNYYETKMLTLAGGKLAGIISQATWGFNVAASDIEFKNGEILSSDSDVDDYLARVGYVVCFDSIINENEKEKFAPICYDAISALTQSGFEFDSIVLCAGRADDVLFSMTVTPETKPSDANTGIVEFRNEQVKKYGVTEEDILEYWMNK